MRDPSRMLALAALASLVVAPLPVAAAPADELPLDRDDDHDDLPLDRDDDHDDLPLDRDDELPLDGDDEPEPGPALDETLDSDVSDALDDGYDPLRDSPEARTARRWLGAGISATVAGAALVGGAIAYGLTDPCDPLAGNNCFGDARNRAALTMGVPGGVLLVGGIAMTVIGALQKRRLFFDYAGGVVAGRDHIGVVLVGRF
ncbi:MAG: hypothetical protein R6X02_17565 [Enhygromyxa sp.]